MINAEEILSIEEFTVDVHLPNGGGTVKGIFDLQPGDVFGDINVSNPVVTLATAVAATLNDEDQLIIENKNYFVASIAENDEGLTAIDLHT